MDNEYTADSIKILKGLEAVRKRPGMYIGGTGQEGLHHLIKELVDNSIDEALAGFCTKIDVILHEDNSVTVKDNGRGIPVEIHKASKKSAAEIVFTQLHAGGKFDNNTYKVSGGLHGVGASVVNALSKKLHVEIFRNNKKYILDFENQKTSGIKEVGQSNEKGTSIRFWPDEKIFQDVKFDYNIIRARLREFAFLNPNVTITLTDEKQNKSEVFHYEGGLSAFIKQLSKNEKILLDNVVNLIGEKDNCQINIALAYLDNYSENIISFVNNIRTPGHGTHVQGFKFSLTKSVKDYINKYGKQDEKKVNLSGEDIREGLIAIISVNIPDPQFEGQTKDKLGNPEVQNIVQQFFYDKFMSYLEENPKYTQLIINKAINAKKARDASRKARELVRRKNILEFSSLPGKLADCSSKDPKLTELFIVEGDSAGGSAKQARNRDIQAIMPLKGKPLNVEKSTLHKILENEEIKTIITALGTDFGDKFDISKLRYNKIIIMSDADVDGSHIQTLLLTLFYRYFRELIINNHIYIAVPPLYKIQKGKKITYLYSDEELDYYKETHKDENFEIQRYKGLGEMNPDQLWETTLNPETRMLKRITINDAIEAEEAFSILMGDKIEPRKKFIVENAQFVKDLDI